MCAAIRRAAERVRGGNLDIRIVSNGLPDPEPIGFIDRLRMHQPTALARHRLDAQRCSTTRSKKMRRNASLGSAGDSYGKTSRHHDRQQVTGEGRGSSHQADQAGTVQIGAHQPHRKRERNSTQNRCRGLLDAWETLMRNPATGEWVPAAKPASIRVKIRALPKLKTAAAPWRSHQSSLFG